MNKQELREKLKKIRQGLVDREAKQRAIERKVFEFLQTKKFESVFIYQSMGSEVDTKKIIEQLVGKCKVLVPRTSIDYEITAEDLVTGEEFLNSPDITIVPLLGFNSNLFRIGFGKGCYDKYFEKYSHTLKIGLAFSEQFVDFKQQPHDIALDVIIGYL